MPIAPAENRPSTTLRHRSLFWAALAIPDQLVPCCFSSASVSHIQLLWGRPLFLFSCGFQVKAWRVVLDAGFLGVCPIQPRFLRSVCLATGSCPARSYITHNFISDLLLLLDVVDAPQTGVEECLDLLLHCLFRPLCLTSVEQDWLHTGVEDAEFGPHVDSSRCPDVFEHDESCFCPVDSGCDVSVCAFLLVNHASQVDKRLHLSNGLSTNHD